MSFKIQITGTSVNSEHPDSVNRIDRELEGDSIACFALRGLEKSTSIGSVIVGEFSIRDLSYILNALRREFGEEDFALALLRDRLSKSLDETTFIEEIQQ